MANAVDMVFVMVLFASVTRAGKAKIAQWKSQRKALKARKQGPVLPPLLAATRSLARIAAFSKTAAVTPPTTTSLVFRLPHRRPNIPVGMFVSHVAGLTEPVAGPIK